MLPLVFLLASFALPKSAAVLPLKSKNLGTSQLSQVLDDLVLAELQQQGAGMRVVGQADIEALLGFDKKKSALGCDSASCIAEIGGALGVDTIVYGSVARLGKQHLLSLSWVKQRDAAVIKRISESIGESEDAFPAKVQKIVAQLLDLPTPASAPANKLTSLASWEILNGTWYENDGAFYGSSGHVSLRGESPKNYKFGVTVEHVSGDKGATLGIGVRTMYVPGKQYRNGTVEMQCYGFNFAPSGIWSVFRGLGGNWFRVNPTEWPVAPQLKSDSSRIEWTVKNADFVIQVNGTEFYRFSDGTLPFGVPLLAVHNHNTVYKFSKMTLTPLD